MRDSSWTRGAALYCLLGAGLAGVGCAGDAEPAGDCRAGSPEPIFSAEATWVERHEFDRQGQRSRELLLTDADSLLVEQAGCDTLVQQFELTVADSVADWAAFRPVAAGRFNALAARDPALFQFEQYARAVEAVPADFPTGQPADLAPGLTLRAYPLPVRSPSRWVVRFEQDLTLAGGAQ